MSYLTQMVGLGLSQLCIRRRRHRTRNRRHPWDRTQGDRKTRKFFGEHDAMSPVGAAAGLPIGFADPGVQGVVQNFQPYTTVDLIQPYTAQVTGADGKTTTQTVTQQVIAQGPVASQEVIKEFGTNGGGFFNANSAHPFENPTPLRIFLKRC